MNISSRASISSLFRTNVPVFSWVWWIQPKRRPISHVDCRMQIAKPLMMLNKGSALKIDGPFTPMNVYPNSMAFVAYLAIFSFALNVKSTTSKHLNFKTSAASFSWIFTPSTSKNSVELCEEQWSLSYAVNAHHQQVNSRCYQLIIDHTLKFINRKVLNFVNEAA